MKIDAEFEPYVQLERTTRRLQYSYLVLFGILACSIVGVQWLSWIQTRRLDYDSELINHAGRQRTLSQRIHLQLVQLHSENDAEQVALLCDRLRASVAEFTEGHAWLSEGAEQGIRGKVSSPAALEILDRLDPLHRSVAQLADDFLALTAGAAADASQHERQVAPSPEENTVTSFQIRQEMEQSAESFLILMDQLVDQLESESAARLRRALTTQTTLLFLLPISMLILIPSLRSASHLASSVRDDSRNRKEFLASVSHEIRTPMTAILGYADILAESPQSQLDREHATRAVQSIRRNGQHLLSIIDDILDLSKIAAGKMSVTRERVNPTIIVESVVSLLRGKAADQQIEFQVRYLSEIPRAITTDPLRLRQVLLNLTANAIKFTERGRVTLEVACDREREQLVIGVADTGIGMSPKQLDRIRRLNAYVQANRSTAGRYGGTGLGLRISNTLTELLGGEMTIDSVEGQGSQFTVRLPLSAEELADCHAIEDVRDLHSPDRLSPSSAALSSDLNGVSVLLAEDGVDNRRLVRFILQRAGATVDTVEDGQAAVAAALQAWRADRAYDVILMDINMPGTDGLAATRQLREDGYTGPIIALTAHALDEEREKCLSMGCDAFVPKPIDRELLLTSIGELAAVD